MVFLFPFYLSPAQRTILIINVAKDDISSKNHYFLLQPAGAELTGRSSPEKDGCVALLWPSLLLHTLGKGKPMAQLHKVWNRMGIFFVGRNRMQNSWWPCGVSKFACWKHLYNGVDLVRFCNLPQKIYTHFSFFGHFSPIFTQPHQIWVFPACFLPSKMIITSKGMSVGHPWFACSHDLHTALACMHCVACYTGSNL